MKPIAKAFLPFSLLLCAGSACAQIISPDQETSAHCGEKVKTEDVMVLDIEPFQGNHQAALDFVAKHAGEVSMYSPAPELIETKWKGAFYDRDSGIKRARKEAAKRGCDLVIVLQAGTNIENVMTWGNSQENMNAKAKPDGTGGYKITGNSTTNSTASSTPIKRAGALVLLGDRKRTKD